MDFAISATPAIRPVERSRVDRPPASTLQDALVERVEASEVKPPSKAPDVQRAAQRLNDALQMFNRDLKVSIHEDGQMVVRITDPSNGEVIRQIPSERLLEVEESLDKIVGLFVNDTA